MNNNNCDERKEDCERMEKEEKYRETKRENKKIQEYIKFKMLEDLESLSNDFIVPEYFIENNTYYLDLAAQTMYNIFEMDGDLDEILTLPNDVFREFLYELVDVNVLVEK